MRAIIVGGGIGGLTAAIALRQRGIDVEVYERSPELREIGAGISLWANAVKALRKLRLGDALDEIGLPNSDGVLCRSDGVELSRTPARELARRFGYGVMVLHRAGLLDLLAREAGTNSIRLDHTCTSVEQDAAGVTAKFENGSSAHGDFLIGADGLHSAIRKALGHADPVRYSGYTAWRCVVPFDTSKLCPSESWGSGRRFGTIPMRGNRVYWFATLNAAERGTDAPEGSRARLLSIFSGWHEPIEALIRAADDGKILRNDIYDREPLASWGRGRITLLGDAAHPMTPNLGQGGCQAIEDALELARYVSQAPAVEAGLRNYEAARIPRTRQIVLFSRRAGAMGQLENPLARWLRDTSVRLSPPSATLRTLASVVGYEEHLV